MKNGYAIAAGLGLAGLFVAKAVMGSTPKVNISASVEGNGWISPRGTTSVEVGTSQSYLIIPAAHHKVVDVLVDGASVGPAYSYAFAEVEEQHTITAVFAYDDYVVTVAPSDSAEEADIFCTGDEDLAAVTQAIAQARSNVDPSTGRARVQILRGNIYSAGMLITIPNLTMDGQGGDTVWNLVAGSNCHAISTNEEECEGITLALFALKGNGPSQSEGMGIRQAGPNGVYDSLLIDGTFGFGVYHNPGSAVIARNCTFRKCPDEGLFIGQSPNSHVAHCHTIDCGTSPTATKPRCINLYLCPGSRVDHNLFDGGGYERQLSCWDCDGVIINRNLCRNSLGMSLAPHSVGAQITHNWVYNAGNNAIDSCGAWDNYIAYNFVSRVTSTPLGSRLRIENEGICVNSQRSIVEYNEVELCGRAGIKLTNDDAPDTGQADWGNIIRYNTIRNCGQQGARAGIWVQVHGAVENDHNRGTVIQFNRVYDDQAAPTQDYGVLLSAGILPSQNILDIVITNNDLRGNRIKGVNRYSPKITTAEIHDNRGDDIP